MDLNRIFLKDACPTKIGGQAVMEGVMMRGQERTAVSVRLPDGRIYLKTEKNKKKSGLAKVPFIRGVIAFVSSLILGTRIMTFSANVLEYFMEDDEDEKPSQTSWNIMMMLSVAVALVISIVVFILMPTVLVNFLGRWITSPILLNLIEGLFRIALFVTYIWLITRMEDIRRVFQYHGAEHKTIHCFENGKDLTPENAKEFYRLHPRCGTSFLMFVMVISLVLFSLLGWPSVQMRIISRLVLIPVVAGISYEVLQLAGRSDNKIVELLSMPGILLQKLTTREPDKSQLEVAIVSMKAVLVDPDTPVFEGICDLDANPVEAMSISDDSPVKETIQAIDENQE